MPGATPASDALVDAVRLGADLSVLSDLLAKPGVAALLDK